jgi:hypothetical protein
MVRDVEIICLLTRRRSGSTGMVECYTRWLQMLAALGLGRRSGRCPLNPCQGRGSSPASRVHAPDTFSVCGCPRRHRRAGQRTFRASVSGRRRDGALAMSLASAGSPVGSRSGRSLGLMRARLAIAVRFPMLVQADSAAPAPDLG